MKTPDHQQIAQRGGSLPTPPGQSADALVRRLELLEQRFADMEMRSTRGDPLKMVFLADVNADGTWKEKAIVSGSMVDYGTPGTDSRNCTSTSDPSKIIKLTGKNAVLLEVEDGTDNYYVQIGVVPLSVPTNPKDLTYSTPHAEAAGQAYDAAFDMTSLGNDGSGTPYDGVKKTVVIGTGYYDPGDQTFYEYRTDEIYDLQGRLVKRNAAYRVSIYSTCASGG